MDVAVGGDGVEIRVDGEPVLEYRAGAGLWKPYFRSLRLPGGPDLLQDAPADHPHHHGLWFGHGRVLTARGQADCWLEKPGCGRIETESLGAVPGGFETRTVWRDAQGAEVARDLRAFTVEVGADRLTLDVRYLLEGEGVRLRGSNEAGLPHIRPAAWIAARGGGRSRDADGRAGEAGMFGQPSRAVDCSGTQQGTVWGIAVFDDAANLGRPTRWFVRDYGPFSPNDGFFAEEPAPLPLRRHYRIVAHRGEIEL